MRIKVFMLLIIMFVACANKQNQNYKNSNNINMENTSQIYLAGGCFWGTEHFLKQINGIINTEVGYANSNIKDPTYKEVCEGNTNAAETVKVEYLPSEISLRKIIKLYLKTIDPTSLNKQGNDRGTQYRTGIYYTNPNDKPIIKNIINDIRPNYNKPIVIEVMPLKNFYKAELYHQDYLEKNPGGYCHIDKELFELARKANQK